jgi:hypothetical protein
MPICQQPPPACITGRQAGRQGRARGGQGEIERETGRDTARTRNWRVWPMRTERGSRSGCPRYSGGVGASHVASPCMQSPRTCVSTHTHTHTHALEAQWVLAWQRERDTQAKRRLRGLHALHTPHSLPAHRARTIRPHTRPLAHAHMRTLTHLIASLHTASLTQSGHTHTHTQRVREREREREITHRSHTYSAQHTDHTHTYLHAEAGRGGADGLHGIGAADHTRGVQPGRAARCRPGKVD